jgi:hypothetical protein
MPEYPIYDADGTEVQVGDWLTGTVSGTIHAPGERGLQGRVQAIDAPFVTVGKEQVQARFNYEWRRYELAGTCGTWERGFYSWGLRVTQVPAGSSHGGNHHPRKNTRRIP